MLPQASSLIFFAERLLPDITTRIAISSNTQTATGADTHRPWHDKAFVLTGAQVHKETGRAERAPHYLETSHPGMLAVGDGRSGSVKRAAAVVEGRSGDSGAAAISG